MAEEVEDSEEAPEALEACLDSFWWALCSEQPLEVFSTLQLPPAPTVKPPSFHPIQKKQIWKMRLTRRLNKKVGFPKLKSISHCCPARSVIEFEDDVDLSFDVRAIKRVD